ncbi:hypothetical protein HYFRA_00001729 [Hymenoscyphus fraxineus]|uniref:Carboxylic ester hydrolase n=1 Tax=Hymenoscyphus fraxineus TaxID=746836 RepID=A0A9N9L788_9HELO|nr:hypothetical protein HYFRA_00001729 [Hymenoscyphus fraxineus]
MMFSGLLAGVVALASFSSVVSAASLVSVASYGSNPGSVGMHIYVPDKLASNPAIIVAMHGCFDSGPAYSTQTKFPAQADKLGFILIYPSATRDNKCFDGNTQASLSHNGGSDSLSIVNMVKYTISKYNADPKKVFATGSSSGGIMSNVLAGAYPDVFAAVAPFSGMPYGCLLNSGGSSPSSGDQNCARGRTQKSPAQWGALVRSGFPGYTGSYPKMETWFGTADGVISYQMLIEQVKEWSNVFGVSWTRNETDNPVRGYTKMVFGDGTRFVAYSVQGVGHVVPTNETSVLDWFGLS